MSYDQGLLYRGTSSGWPGNPVLRSLRVTPTTFDPLVAALFALESQRFGKGIVLVCRRSQVSRLIGPPNFLAEIESEVVIDVAPLEFAERFAEWTVPVEAFCKVLMELGYQLPAVVGDKRALKDRLADSARLCLREIAEFERRFLGEMAQ